MLRDGASRLDCQVVRPPCEGDRLWSTIARGAAVHTRHASAAAAEEIKKAIMLKEKKIPPAQRGSITLVIDSIETPAFLLGHVPDEFLRIHGGWARSLRFAAIWLVGPTSSLAVQLA